MIALQESNLKSCNFVGNAGLAPLDGMTAMQRPTCDVPNDAVLVHLSRVTAMDELTVGLSIATTDSELAQLASMRDMRKFS